MILDKAALTIVILGALDLGAVGIFGFDTVAYLCGSSAGLPSRIVCTLFGLAGLWCITLLFRPDPNGGRYSRSC
jgi:uncharacterized membrane protein YuzA (DUF378 family)